MKQGLELLVTHFVFPSSRLSKTETSTLSIFFAIELFRAPRWAHQVYNVSSINDSGINVKKTGSSCGQRTMQGACGFKWSCPRHYRPPSLRQGSGALAWSNTASPQFTVFLSNLANLIGWEYEKNTLHMLRISGPARVPHASRRPDESWALERMRPRLKTVDGGEIKAIFDQWQRSLLSRQWILASKRASASIELS